MVAGGLRAPHVRVSESAVVSMTVYEPFLDRIRQQSDRALHLVLQWAEINSGSRNIVGLDRMCTALAAGFSVLKGETRTVELGTDQVVKMEGTLAEMQLGKALSITKRGDARLRVLLCGHMDTVYPEDHPFQRCVRLDDNRLQGPGVADAKGGLVVMLNALEAFERSPWADRLGWEVLINPDEEIGSPGSAPLLAAAAHRNQLGLVFEPAFPDGALVGARRGTGNFTVLVRGRAAHAGREPHMGRNAIDALARFIVDLKDLHGAGPQITVNVGTIRGGGPVNVVPDLAVCRINVRVAEPGDQRRFEGNLEKLSEEINWLDGISVEVRGGFTRPPKPLDAQTGRLLDYVAECGHAVGLSIAWRPSGGACDGNNLAAEGLPTVDSLGAVGGNLHSTEEYMFLDSLTQRAQLIALLLMKLASGEIVVR